MAATAVASAGKDILGSVLAEEKLGPSIGTLSIPAARQQLYPFTNLVEALRYAAAHTTEGIIAYESHKTNEPESARQLSYAALLSQAEANASLLRHHAPDKIRAGSPVLVHFGASVDSIVWYWSVLMTGAVPVLTGPNMFNENVEDQEKHLKHLYKTLDGPVCLTRRSLRGPFDTQTGQDRIDTYFLEDLPSAGPAQAATGPKPSEFEPQASDLAALMLTSGSSGAAKVVPLTHGQIIAACNGKTRIADLQFGGRPFLCWVGMDHVTNLTQCHLYGVMACLSQVQVQAADIVADPLQLLRLVSRHRVSRTFAPNFLLVKLLRLLESGRADGLGAADIDLSGLVLIDSGGEANVTDVAVRLQPWLSKFGARDPVIAPGFGMTETCAGITSNLDGPEWDQKHGLDFLSVGGSVPGARMRVSRLNSPGSGGEGVELCEPGERGSLELSGPVVFKGYYNNAAATSESFTEDGWFRPGDLAWLDERGFLHLDGRTKDVMNINAVKYLPEELESLLERAEIAGTTPSYFCCFSTRDASMDTEVVNVLYVPSYAEDDDEARFHAQSSIVRITGMHTYSRPQVLPLSTRDMPKSALGKLSRGKLRAALQAGDFDAQRRANDEALQRHRDQTRQQPSTPEEAAILAIFREQLELSAEDDDFAANDSILSVGTTSMTLVAILHRLNSELKLARPVTIGDLLQHPTAKDLAASFSAGRSPAGGAEHEYNPVVVIQPHGSKPPVWLIHPGVGEILAFVILARYVTDRPVYALRAKGFNPERGDAPFESLDEIFDTYLRHIKRVQPAGPYGVAGYSFGGMIAFETAKRLEARGDEVRYCGSWNLPPHIADRMQELDWSESLIHLFYFIRLMTEDEARSHKAVLTRCNNDGRPLDAIRHMRAHSDAGRWDELGLSEEYYLSWVNLATRMQSLASTYEPSGSVKCMDVFVADPLSHLARDRDHWVESRLSGWRGFVRGDVQFRHVQGQHYTMLNEEYAAGFAKTLRSVLSERGM